MRFVRVPAVAIVALIVPAHAAAQRPGVNYCSEHPTPVHVVTCPNDLKDCDRAWNDHQCQVHKRCSGAFSPNDEPDPPNPLGVVGPPAAFAAIGWLVGEQTKSTTTGKSMGLPGLYSGVTLGGLVTTAVVAERSTSAAVLTGGLTGLAGGQALTEYNKAQDKEPNQAANLGVGAGIGAMAGLTMPFIQENSQPDWLKRRLGPKARIIPVAGIRLTGIVITW